MLTKTQRQVLIRYTKKFVLIHKLKLDLEVQLIKRKWLDIDSAHRYGYSANIFIPDIHNGGFERKYVIQLATMHSWETILQTLGHELTHILVWEDLEYVCDDYANVLKKECLR